MDQADRSTRRRRRGRTAERIAVAASVVVHVLILAALGLVPGVLRTMSLPPDRPVRIYLVPERIPKRPPSPSRIATAPPAVAPTRVHLSPPPPAGAPKPLPLPATPATAAATGPAIRFYDLQVPGCGREDLVLMAPAERMACENRIAAAKADGYRQWRKPGDAVLPAFIPNDKRGAYSVEAAANARRRARYDPDIPMSAPIVPCSGPGSNFGVGCLPDTSMTNVGRH